MNSLVSPVKGSLTAATQIGADLMARFIRYKDASPKTIETYTRAIRQLVNYLASRGITQPQREDILAYREQLKQDHEPTTVQNYIIAARQFFGWLESEGIYPNVAKDIKGAKLKRIHKRDYFSPSQIQLVLKRIDRSTAQGRRDYAMIALMVTCGLRTIEVSRANIGDLGLAGDTTVIYVQGKGVEDRADYVKLTPIVEGFIRETFADRAGYSDTDPLFISTSNNSAGKRLTTRSISAIVKKHFIDAGFNSKKRTAHSLRHTAVTLALKAGKSIDEAQQFARHANIATTMIYNHALDRDKNSCGEAVAKAIF
jgi:integrase/recombinase XerC